MAYWYIFTPWVLYILTYRTAGHLTSTLHSEFMKLNTSFLTSTSLNLNSYLSFLGETNIYPISKAEIWVSSLIPSSLRYHISNQQNLKLCISFAWLHSYFRRPSFLTNITAVYFFCSQRWIPPVYLPHCRENALSRMKTSSWSSSV